MWTIALTLMAATSPMEVYTVDLGRAVLQTPEGKSIAGELSKRHRESEAEIRKREDLVASRRSRLAPEDYTAEVERLQRSIEAAERSLAAEQDELLAPQLERMRGLMSDGEAKAGGAIRIVAQTDAPFVGASKACDLTTWLARAAKAGRVEKSPPRDDACRFRHFFYVRFDDVITQMKSAQKAMARLDQVKERYQSELDMWQKQLREVAAKADETKDPKWSREHTRLAREIEQKYGRLQEKLEREELAAQSELYGRIEATLGRIAAQVEQVGFVERLDGAKVSLSPRCEISSWTAALLNGDATVDDLKKVCPGVASK